MVEVQAGVVWWRIAVGLAQEPSAQALASVPAVVARTCGWRSARWGEDLSVLPADVVDMAAKVQIEVGLETFDSHAAGRRVVQYLDVGMPMVQDRWWIAVGTPNAPRAEVSGGTVRELAWRSSTDASQVAREEVHPGFGVSSAHRRRQTLIEDPTWVDPGGNLSPALLSWFDGRSIRDGFASMVEGSREPALGVL